MLPHALSSPFSPFIYKVWPTLVCSVLESAHPFFTFLGDSLLIPTILWNHPLKPAFFSQLSGCSSDILTNSSKPKNLKDALVHSAARLNHRESVVLLFFASVVPFSKPQTCESGARSRWRHSSCPSSSCPHLASRSLCASPRIFLARLSVNGLFFSHVIL